MHDKLYWLINRHLVLTLAFVSVFTLWTVIYTRGFMSSHTEFHPLSNHCIYSQARATTAVL